MNDIAPDSPSVDSAPFVSPTTRKVMRANTRRDTKPELKVRRWLHAQGFRFRVDKAGLPGRPDIAFPRLRRLFQRYPPTPEELAKGIEKDAGRNLL